MSGTPSNFFSRARGPVKPLNRFAAACLIALLVVLAASERASALSLEQARENCRETVGHPIVHACMQGLGKGGDREANLAKCRAGVQPKMTACVHAAMNAANGRANVAIEVYKNGKPKADVVDENASPAFFFDRSFCLGSCTVPSRASDQLDQRRRARLQRDRRPASA